MNIFEIVQWVLGALLLYYLFKGLLGRFKEGDFTRAAGVGLIWLGVKFLT